VHCRNRRTHHENVGHVASFKGAWGEIQKKPKATSSVTAKTLRGKKKRSKRSHKVLCAEADGKLTDNINGHILTAFPKVNAKLKKKRARESLREKSAKIAN